MINRKPTTTVNNSGENSGIIVANANLNGPINVIENTHKKGFHSLIPQLIEKLSELTNLLDEDLDKTYKVTFDQIREYDINEKIEYNDVMEYRYIIDEYSQYCTICEDAFNIIDNNNMGTKNKLLRSINLLYKQYKGKLFKQYKFSGIDEMTIIRENSDKIINNIKLELEKRILDDGQAYDISIEDIDVGLARIICYAFVECKILEKPR